MQIINYQSAHKTNAINTLTTATHSTVITLNFYDQRVTDPQK